MEIDDEHYRNIDSEYDRISNLVWTQNLDELREYLERGGNPLLEKDSKYSDGTSRMDDGESLLYISMFLHPNIEVSELLLHYIGMHNMDPNTQLNNGTLLKLLQFRYERDPRNEMNNRLLEMLINAIVHYLDMHHMNPNIELNNGTLLLEFLDFRYERDPHNETNYRLLEMLINAVDRYEQHKLYLAEQRLRMMTLHKYPQRGEFPINNELLYNISKYI